MKSLIVLSAFFLPITVMAQGRDQLLGKASAGINFAGPADWSTELPLVDVFRLSRKWISQREGAGWNQGPEPELDADGYVVRLEPGTWVETPVCTIEGGHYPSGTYTLLFKGSGEIEIGGAGTIATRRPGRYTVTVDSTKGPIWVRIKRTDPSDHLRDIHLVMPGFEDTFRENPWRPDFVKMWSQMKAFRSMDWQLTNDSTIQSAADFPKMSDRTWTTKGLPLELICDFANRTQITPWVCVPHLADDEAIEFMAETIKRSLGADKTLIVEYSNEVWNGQFAQNKYAGQKGIELGLDSKPWAAAWKYTGKRSIEVFQIFERVFGGTDRLVRVLPSQSANPFVAKQVVASALRYGQADALAIAPYFGKHVKPEEVDEVLAKGIDVLIAETKREELPLKINHMAENHAVAKENGLALIAYEAGQHFVGIRQAVNREDLTAMLIQLNADPRMAELYEIYLKAWDDNGGALMCLFSSTSEWSKWGCWGLTQYADEDPESSPKMRAVTKWSAGQ